jgi:hypothetical protein
MERSILTAALLSTLALSAVPAAADVGFGADVVSRYVWRGTDFGNAVSVQPGMSYSTGSVEVGAWSSWAINGGGANENDLYVSFSAGPVGITVTDYYFPGLTAADNFFSYGDGDAVHILEASASLSLEDMPLSLMAAFNFSGDSENSFWIEANYDLGEIEETAVSVTIGAGNGVYTTDTDPMLASVGVNFGKGDYFASYILNPDKESTFLVFGKSF